MYEQLIHINNHPQPFSIYTADTLWTDPHIAQQMLKAHLNPNTDSASRRAAFIEASVNWLQTQFNVRPGTRIADFGCGPGLYTTRLAQLGAAVTIHLPPIASPPRPPIHMSGQNRPSLHRLLHLPHPNAKIRARRR